MVDGWRERTPPGFLFAAKFPRSITHERLLSDCAQECGAFLKAMDCLGDKLGPLLLQFRYFRRDEFPDPKPFLDRLEVFLAGLPRGRRYAVEVRNKSFVNARLLDLLRHHGAALALIDHPWFTAIERLMRASDVLTADFAYIRWLGDRKAIERRTARWDRVIVDRTRDMGRWVPAIRAILDRGRTVYGYFNNHYAGYAIGSIDLFRNVWVDAGDLSASGAPAGPGSPGR